MIDRGLWPRMYATCIPNTFSPPQAGWVCSGRVVGMPQRMQSHGISLIEVLIALVILAVSMIALARMQGISTVKPAAAAGIAEASSLANRVATQCKEFEGEQTKGRETVAWLDNRYVVEWSAIQHDNPNRQYIAVQVSWEDLEGLPRTSKLSSLIYCGHRDATKLALRRMRQELPEGYSNAE